MGTTHTLRPPIFFDRRTASARHVGIDPDARFACYDADTGKRVGWVFYHDEADGHTGRYATDPITGNPLINRGRAVYLWERRRLRFVPIEG